MLATRKWAKSQIACIITIAPNMRRKKSKLSETDDSRDIYP
jgi:hypothetical protein